MRTDATHRLDIIQRGQETFTYTVRITNLTNGFSLDKPFDTLEEARLYIAAKRAAWSAAAKADAEALVHTETYP